MGWISDLSDSQLNWVRYWHSGSQGRARRKRLLERLEVERRTWRSLDQSGTACASDRETVIKALLALEARPQTNHHDISDPARRNPPENN